MNTVSTAPAEFDSMKADRIGVVASVLCAIHCAAAPILLLTLPAFGTIWAHPASHILVALLVVPLAVVSIRKGFRVHGKRWILGSAFAGVFFVLVGAALPALSEEPGSSPSEEGTTVPVEEKETAEEEAGCNDPACEDCEDAACQEGSCESAGAAGEVGDSGEAAACVDGCCPTATIADDGTVSLHVPPASIVTTLGGVFLIAAHLGNICACGRACRKNGCQDCAPGAAPGSFLTSTKE